MATISISTEDLKQITLAVGSILVELETNGQPLLYNDDQILDIAVLPALELYFSKFPIEVNYEIDIASSATITIPFPDQYTFGVTNLSVVNRTGGNKFSGDYFWNIHNYNQTVGNRGYGTGKNINGSKHLIYTKQAEQDTLSNAGTYRYTVDLDNRQIIVYSDFSGYVTLTWAKYSYDFNKVNFVRKREVIDLARGYLLKHTGEMLGMIPDLGANIDIDSGNLKDAGTEYIDRITELWLDVTKVAILRT